MRTQKLVRGNPSNVSWGRSSLYSCIHSALNLAHLSQRLEHIGVEHLVAEGPIEPFPQRHSDSVGLAEYTAARSLGLHTNTQIDRRGIPGHCRAESPAAGPARR